MSSASCSSYALSGVRSVRSWRLLDVPSGRKEAVDKALLVDLVLFALDTPPPAVVLLISVRGSPSPHNLRAPVDLILPPSHWSDLHHY